MSKLHSKYFGEIERGDESAFHFALGLPAFEEEKSLFRSSFREASRWFSCKARRRQSFVFWHFQFRW